MNYPEYAERMKTVPYPSGLAYHIAFMWVHPERLPLTVISLGDEIPPIVKIPHKAVNNVYNLRYNYTVPVVAFSRKLFQCGEDITDIILPSSVYRIPEGAFAGCKNLRRITIPKKVRYIGEGTFAGCENLTDIYYEGTREEWEQIKIVHQKHECEFGDLIPGTPVAQITAERLVHIPGNEPLFSATLHFHCDLEHAEGNPEFHIQTGGTDITELFRTPD